MTDPHILIRRKSWSPGERLKAMEAPGRKAGKPHGAFVAGDLAELKKAIILCDACHHKFDWKRAGYYPVYKYEKTPVMGNCDACRVMCQDARLFLYEPTVPRAWLTKDESRRIRRHAITIGG